MKMKQIPFNKLYTSFTFYEEKIDNLKFENKYRKYTFTKDILNHIYANWKTAKNENKIRKIGKILNNKFIFEIEKGDRLTNVEIDELKQFMEEEFLKEEKQYVKELDTTKITKEQWLQERKRGIGGSDVASILNQNKYKNSYQLWLEKTGQIEIKFEGNYFTTIGNLLEEFVAQEFCRETNKEVKKETNFLIHKEYPFMIANIDRWVVGENAGLECKTANIFKLKEYEKGNIPKEYILQCMHYMAITGATHWYLAVLIVGTANKFFTFKIPRSEHLIKIIIQKEKEFWECIQNKKEPEINIDGEDITTKRLLENFVEQEEKTIIFDEYKLKEYDSINKKIKELEQQKEKIKQEILIQMDGNTNAISENFKLKISETTRNTFDKKKLFELMEIPEEIKEKCTKITTNKTFTIKKILEEK